VINSIDQRLRLTLSQLEVFVAIARAGSTRKAADQVARSQSATSSALAELEVTLGVELFDRLGRRLLLNENGRALLPRAVALVEQACEVQTLYLDKAGASLRIAASFTIGEYLLPQLLLTWKQQHPSGQVRLDIANTRDVLEAVSGFAVDVGFIEGQRSHPELAVRRWMSDELVIVAAPRHPLAGQVATARRLQDATWILREQGSGTREAADRWLTSRLERVEVGLELGSNEAVKRAVASGLGLGCLSRLAVAHALREGWLLELRTALPPIQRTLSVVVPKAKRLGSAAQDFVRDCFDFARAIPR